MTEGNGHVLVVDDEMLAASGMSRFLARRGYRVSTAGDGVEAMNLDERDPADVVITDMRMPRCGGEALVDALRARRPELPIVVVTGQLLADPAIGRSGDGRLVVLRKPVSLRELAEVVARMTSPAGADPEPDLARC